MQLFTSESVTAGHPDKLADRISDSVLDAVMAADPRGRVACETMVANGAIVLAGEITTSARIDYVAVVREAIRQIGYTDPEIGLCADTCAVEIMLSRQSPEIAAGVDENDEHPDTLGAGDQGIMFGYACSETEELMPLPIQLAHALTRRLTEVRETGIVKGLRPDGKSQVTVSYSEDGTPERVVTVVLAAQHEPDIDLKALRRTLRKSVVSPALGEWDRDDLDVRINTAGPFTIGGPAADAGLTGRKIIVDTYGGRARHGGGAFSGKDATKVDRSAAYAARHVAKNVVAAGLADECEVQIGYAIGQAAPVSVRVETFGTGRYPRQILEQEIGRLFDLRPASIIERFGLRAPLFAPLSAHGHVGRAGLAWERTELADQLAAAVKSRCS
jgi:S-adenosylmethionine synthetase